MKIVLAESAVRDLEDIVTFYADRDVPDVGSRVVSEILNRIEGLGEHPDSERVVPEFDTPRLRELIHPPFRIVYRREKHRVSIVSAYGGVSAL